MPVGVGAWVLLSLATLPTACRGKERAAERNAPAVTPSFQRATTSVAVTDDDLTAYLAWWHGWMSLTNRHRAEGDAVTERAAAKLSFADTGKIAQDPDLLALIAVQGKEMRAHFNSMPKGPATQALMGTVPGVGAMVVQTGGIAYVAGRNEVVLAEARKKYGDTFVDWVLARESIIVDTLSR
jgi:hypothetical protein